MLCSGGRSSSSGTAAAQTDHHCVPLYEQVLPDRVKPPVPSKPSLTTASCDVPPADEDYREIWSPPIPPRPASSEPVRTDPDQHLYEDISVLLDQRKTDGGADCAGKGKRFSSSGLMESDTGLRVKSGLLPGWDHVFDEEQQEEHDQCRRFAQTVQRIRSVVQLYQQVLFLRGTGMMNFITQLNCIADELDKTVKKTCITGGTTGAIGTAAILAGIALAPVTLGASLAVAGIGGGDRRRCGGGRRRHRSVSRHQQESQKDSGPEEGGEDPPELSEPDGGRGGVPEVHHQRHGAPEEAGARGARGRR
ncbi:uncharacterized protein LOC107705875 [Sinocyclocheilus rhinocerous]|uniref:uncharacterized protein LOC107705875 n=1 Tax=Sinocyclocheilus rhinocerous TaxID=307959 RepID=UPI0007B9BC38|nr:PREDICTED: uncharacterized protein LOC107705875 [Sinocyclocheilus rhinocerous]